MTTFDLTVVSPKKHSVRFDSTAQDDALPVTNLYVDKVWVRDNGGCENGIRITIEPIPEGN